MNLDNLGLSVTSSRSEVYFGLSRTPTCLLMASPFFPRGLSNMIPLWQRIDICSPVDFIPFFGILSETANFYQLPDERIPISSYLGRLCVACACPCCCRALCARYYFAKIPRLLVFLFFSKFEIVRQICSSKDTLESERIQNRPPVLGTGCRGIFF
jgi:hypothetical protein